jgi:hypothetical protein
MECVADFDVLAKPNRNMAWTVDRELRNVKAASL